jgi:hypothetical protein
VDHGPDLQPVQHLAVGDVLVDPFAGEDVIGDLGEVVLQALLAEVDGVRPFVSLIKIGLLFQVGEVAVEKDYPALLRLLPCGRVL